MARAGSLRARAEAGAALLDEHFGSKTWDKEVDAEKLDLGSTCNCVLGETFGSFSKGYDRLQLGRHRRGRAEDFGFDAALVRDMQRAYRRLTRVWRELLADRIAARKRT